VKIDCRPIHGCILSLVVMVLPYGLLFGQTPQVTLERTLTAHTKNVHSAPISRDGRFLASASSDQTVKFWEIESGRELKSFSGHTGDVNTVAISPDGQLLASGSDDKTVRIWEVSAGRELYNLAGHTGFVQGVAFSPDGKLLASVSYDKTVRLWNPAREKKSAR
jgi:WD40 repeat protein